MNFELKRVSPLRGANLVAAMYFVMFASFSLLFLPFAGTIQPDPNVPPGFFSKFLLAYPILGGAMGWVVGLFGAFVYNGIARVLGGFKIELSQDPGA